MRASCTGGRAPRHILRGLRHQGVEPGPPGRCVPPELREAAAWSASRNQGGWAVLGLRRGRGGGPDRSAGPWAHCAPRPAARPRPLRANVQAPWPSKAQDRQTSPRSLTNDFIAHSCDHRQPGSRRWADTQDTGLPEEERSLKGQERSELRPLRHCGAARRCCMLTPVCWVLFYSSLTVEETEAQRPEACPSSHTKRGAKMGAD